MVDPNSAPQPKRDITVDVIALLLMLAGLVGLVVVAFNAHPLAGWGLVSVAALACGYVLSRRDL